jgi:hypothetical protein
MFSRKVDYKKLVFFLEYVTEQIILLLIKSQMHLKFGICVEKSVAKNSGFKIIFNLYSNLRKTDKSVITVKEV